MQVWQGIEVGAKGRAIVHVANRLGELVAVVDGNEDRVAFVNVASDDVAHREPLPCGCGEVSQPGAPEARRFHQITPGGLPQRYREVTVREHECNQRPTA